MSRKTQKVFISSVVFLTHPRATVDCGSVNRFSTTQDLWTRPTLISLRLQGRGYLR